MKPKLSVIALHDDGQARETAIVFCDQLVHRFWADCDIEVRWLPFALLLDEIMAAEAVAKAAEAQLILFATRDRIPNHVERWIQQWLLIRNDREGILVGLLASQSNSPSPDTDTHSYLREIAHRAGMDYLTGVPQTIR